MCSEKSRVCDTPDGHDEAVIDGLLGREEELKGHILILSGGICETKVSGEVDGVGAVPEESFLAVREVE
jgi:hypothetical protein